MGEFDAPCGRWAFGFGHAGRGRSAVTGAGVGVAPPTSSTHPTVRGGAFTGNDQAYTGVGTDTRALRGAPGKR